MDVTILGKACLHFWRNFIEQNKVDPFQEAVTIASACNLVFRRNFLQPDTIGIMTTNAYRLADRQLLGGVKLLLWTAHTENVNIEYSFNGREVRLPEGFLVDGYDKNSKTVYEIHGYFFRGCEQCYANQMQALYANSNDALVNRREQTEMKVKRMKEAGYNVKEM